MPQISRVAFLSLHTSPLEQPGTGDAGGMNVYVRSLASSLAAAGTEVEVFTRAVSPGQPSVEHPEAGVCVHNIQAGPVRRIPKEQLPGLIHQMADEISAIRASQPQGHYQVIHSHYWLSGVAGVHLARDWDVPLVHTMHTMARVKNQHLHSGEHAEPENREQGEQLIVDRAARLVANTPTEARELQSHYDASPELIDIVAPGVDLDVFTPRTAARAASDGEFHVVFAGRMQRLKGPHVLVHAAAALRARRPDIPLRVTLLGEQSGARQYDIDSFIESCGVRDIVTRLDAVPRAELADWFRAADVVAMPSYSESFGLVALEAQACGTPVLATRVGGLSEAVADGVSGLLLEDHRITAWAAALERLHDDVAFRAVLSAGAVRHAAAFGWDRAARATLGAYGRALTGVPSLTV
ncbi:D-inositol-3-phosphate glycosyltransferase [Arthrobacter sp. NPDC090010]|uniref:D-inositol-3-phosphate glycosyltransferase n=1 Tax=Arthrobacter sp. NPDC090010 TaxID=3363942 RepID=UPI003830ECC5